MNNAARIRLRLLAGFLPATAVLYVAAEALNPRGTDQVITSTAVALRVLPVAASHSAQLYLSGSLTVLALGGLAVSYAAIAALVTRRGWVLATVAALLGALGAFAGAMVNVLAGVNLAAAASAHMSEQAAARFLVTSFHSAPSQMAVYAYFLSEYAAPVVMGLALWRSRSVPRWLAVLFTAGLEIAETQGSGGPKVVLFMLPFAVAMVLLAARIWQAAASPAAQPNDTAPPPSAASPLDLATTPLRTGPGN
ncbi:MAG TPA: hypothetical protein VIJ82_32525 [Streptosporangiaceae bacterium]|jgi:hypothetical protein